MKKWMMIDLYFIFILYVMITSLYFSNSLDKINLKLINLNDSFLSSYFSSSINEFFLIVWIFFIYFFLLLYTVIWFYNLMWLIKNKIIIWISNITLFIILYLYLDKLIKYTVLNFPYIFLYIGYIFVFLLLIWFIILIFLIIWIEKDNKKDKIKKIK